MSAQGKIRVIAVDGPAASGKGTLARRLAQHFDFACLDTGLLYRATGLLLLRRGQDPEDETLAEQAARDVLELDFSDPELRSESTGKAASQAAALPAVRQALLEQQHSFAACPPDGKAGAVLDGRDIGTVVCPDADAKIFVSAPVEIRAERRYRELLARGEKGIYQSVLEDLQGRDARDQARTVAPLAAAADAFVLENGSLNADETVEAALAWLATRPAFS